MTVNGMQWLALGTWLLVMMMALPAAAAMSPTLVLQSLIVGLGFVSLVVFLAAHLSVFAWGAVGCAVVGGLIASIGAYSLVQDEGAARYSPGHHRRETSASMVGLELPFLFAAAILTGIAAFG